MMNNKEFSYFHLLLFILGIGFFLIYGIIIYQEYNAEWRKYQKEFIELEKKIKSPPQLKVYQTKIGIKQIYIPELNLIERCISCHLGMEDPDYKNAKQPFRTHPGNYLENHPIEAFGCTLCHSGQGYATNYKAAAHNMIEYWDEPMLPKEIMEANCGRCHQGLNVPNAYRLNEGRKLIADSGCYNCHDIPGYEQYEFVAPELDTEGNKVYIGWLFRWLKNPKKYSPTSRMPRFRLKDNEIKALVAFILSQKTKPIIDENLLDISKGDPVEGKKIFGEARCITCHSIEGRGGKIAPDLSHVGSKIKPPWIYSFLKNTHFYFPYTKMLQYNFNEKQLIDLTAYLTQELIDYDYPPEEEAKVKFYDYDLANSGKKVFENYGCYSCHKMKGFENLGKIGPTLAGIGSTNPNKLDFHNINDVQPNLANWLFLKITKPDFIGESAKMPAYDFSPEEAAKITIALLSIKKEALPANKVVKKEAPTIYKAQGEFGKVIDKYRCLSCHSINSFGGSLSTVPLEEIGSKLQKDYLINYLLNPGAVRVNLEERMPQFYMEKKEAEILADYFTKVFLNDQWDNYQIDKSIESINKGKKLFDELGCIGCHIIGDSGGYVGPNLNNAGDRLKAGWIAAWLKNPQAHNPETIQPNYNLSDEQIKYLTSYLMSLHEK